MIEMNILRRGDEVIAINEQFLAVKRRKGSVDLFRVYFTDSGEISIDPVKIGTVGFGNGFVSKELEDGETTVYSF